MVIDRGGPMFSLYRAVFMPVGTGDCIIMPPPGVCTTFPMWSTMCPYPIDIRPPPASAGGWRIGVC